MASVGVTCRAVLLCVPRGLQSMGKEAEGLVQASRCYAGHIMVAKERVSWKENPRKTMMPRVDIEFYLSTKMWKTNSMRDFML